MKKRLENEPHFAIWWEVFSRARSENPARSSRGRSATQTSSTTSPSASTAPGLNAPTTSKSSPDGGHVFGPE
jgi:hypothetical protein